MNRRSEEDVLAEFETRSRKILGVPDAEVTDGRVKIRLRNREKIIDALVALVVEGKAGTIDEIVERSGVARRSIFRHFNDLSELMLAAMVAVVANSAPHGILKDLGVGPLDRRLGSFVDARLQTLARMHPFRSAANARLIEHAAIRAGVIATTEMLRGQIATHFARELRTVRAGDVEKVIDAIYVVSSYESYDVSVVQLGRSVEEVRASWLLAIKRLLGS